MYFYEVTVSTLSFLRDELLRPLYMSVTWMLNKLLGCFSPYIGIEQSYPLMLTHELSPPEPDCSILMDWIPFVALVFGIFYSLAIMIIVVEARRAPGPGKYPEDHSNDPPTEGGTGKDPAEENGAISSRLDPPTEEGTAKDPAEENGAISSRFEDFWYPVGEGQWRCNVKFVTNGHEKVFYVYSDDVEEMREIIQNGLPDYAVNGVFEYMLKTCCNI